MKLFWSLLRQDTVGTHNCGFRPGLISLLWHYLCVIKSEITENNNNVILVPHFWLFVNGLCPRLIDSPHKGSVMRKAFRCHDVVMLITPWHFYRHSCQWYHYNDVIMGTKASQITSLTVVYSIVYSGADQRKHQSYASLAFVRGIHRDRWIPRTKGQ